MRPEPMCGWLQRNKNAGKYAKIVAEPSNMNVARTSVMQNILTAIEIFCFRPITFYNVDYMQW